MKKSEEKPCSEGKIIPITDEITSDEAIDILLGVTADG